MRAVVITEAGGPDVLRIRDVAVPEPREREILVRVAATAINRADLLQRRGGYPSPPGWPADVPGLEYAGTVEAVADGVEGFRTGDRVMGIVGGGSYAEYLTVDEREAMRVPDRLSLEQAAAVPEAFITAHDAIITQGSLSESETLLVHAVGSGVGTAAVQIAKAAGARSFGTSRSKWKLQRALELGLDVAIDTGTEDFAERIAGDTAARGADVILDLVGGDCLTGNVRCLAKHGRIIIVGLVAGSSGTLDMRALMSKRAMIRGTVLRSRAPAEKAAATRAFADYALPLIESGALRPVIDRVMKLEEVADAHRSIEAAENFGKIVLTI
jgi:putative PIG3 family NAD(P)H quinone oxidoreductase